MLQQMTNKQKLALPIHCYAPGIVEPETKLTSHSQECQCHQEFKVRVAFYLASEGEKVKTTNKRIYLPTFLMQIKTYNKKATSYLTPK